jgi:hypothetical protein
MQAPNHDQQFQKPVSNQDQPFHLFTICVLSLSFWCLNIRNLFSCIIASFVRIRQSWINHGKLPMNIRFPFYIAVTDALILGSASLAYSPGILYGEFGTGGMCL